MYFDALTVLAVRDELSATLLGGRVQHVHLPDDQSLALEVYAEGQRHWLYANWQPQQARVHLVAERPARASDHVTPLLLLLRKYAGGARIEAVEQPPLERILRLRLFNRLLDGTLVRTELVVEVLGRQSNVILLDEDGAVLDAARRVDPEASRTRVILPHWRYAPPAPQLKRDPRTLAPDELRRAAEASPGRSPEELLVGAVDACSPLLAREVISRAYGDGPATPRGPEWRRVADAMRGIWDDALNGRAVPSIAMQAGQILAYAPYLLHCFRMWSPSQASALPCGRGRRSEGAR